MFKNLLPRLCVLMISLLSLSQLQAQEGGIQYQYKDFRFPNIDRKALEGSFNLAGSSSSLEYGNNLIYQDSRFINSISGIYSRFRNLEKIQAQELLGFNSSIDLNRSQTELPSTRDSTSGRFLILPNYNSEYRYYFVPNKFLGFELDVYTGYDYRYSRNDFLNTRSSSTSFNVSVAPTFQFGWGRLEPIDDVFLAKFMVDDMKEAGILNQDLSQEELFALGSTMAFVRNQRIFDFRRLRMYELTEIDKWFSGSGLVDNQDFRYFTVLADNWLYAFRNTRFSGNRISIGLRPSVQWSDDILGDDIRNRATLGLNLGANYQIHTPINQYWQSITEFSAGVSYFCPSCRPNNQTLLLPYIQAGQSYGWYPNSRTRFNANGSVRYTPLFQRDQEFLTKTNSVNANVNMSTDYFINFQFRVRANVGYTFLITNRIYELSNFIDYTQTYRGFQSNISLLYTFF